jgi:hypothetical protein
VATSQNFTIRCNASSAPSWWPANNTVASITLGSSAHSVADAATALTVSLGAYSGGALATVSSDPYLIVKGGGHTDGSWNGSIKIGPLNSSSMTSTVFLGGSSSARTGPTYADGRAAASHTYNNLVGVGSTVYEVGCDAYWDNANGADILSAYTPSGETTLATPNRVGFYGAAAAYSGYIFYMESDFNGGTCQLRRYNISGNSWDTEPSAGITNQYDVPSGVNWGYTALAIDSSRGVAMMMNNQISVGWRTLTGTIARRTGANIVGSGAYDMQLCYVPTYDRYVAIYRQTRTISYLDAGTFSTWVTSGGTAPSWSTTTLSGSTPIAPDANTNFIAGRAQPVDFPGLGGGIFYYPSPTNTNLYFYRLY